MPAAPKSHIKTGKQQREPLCQMGSVKPTRVVRHPVPEALWHLFSAGVISSLRGFAGLRCSDGVKDHFSLVLVACCNTAGESVLRSPSHSAYGLWMEEVTETSSRRVSMAHMQICFLYEGSFKHRIHNKSYAITIFF